MNGPHDQTHYWDFSFCYQFPSVVTVSVQVDQRKYHNNLTVSSLRYTPTTPQDYGVLNCWARNDQARE